MEREPADEDVPKAEPALVLHALRVAPPHVEWSAFLGVIRDNRGAQADRVAHAAAVIVRQLAAGTPDRMQAWLRPVPHLGSWPAADVRAVRARVAEAWRRPDPLQRDTVEALDVLADLAEAREAGLQEPAWMLLAWLLGHRRAPRWHPSFAEALRNDASLRAAPIEAELARHAAKLERVTARVRLDLRAALDILRAKP